MVSFFTILLLLLLSLLFYCNYCYPNALRACTATVPMTQSDVPEGSRRLRRLCRFILLPKCQKTTRDTSPEASRWLRKAICFGPDAISSSKKRADDAQESSKMNLEAFFGRSRGPREPPRHAPEVPKGPRGSPKTLKKPCSDRKLCFVENIDISIVKPSFLRVGGSAWEFKIHPERLRKKRKLSQSHLWQQEASKGGPI